MVINLEQKKIQFDLRFTLTYSTHRYTYDDFFLDLSVSRIIKKSFVNTVFRPGHEV